MMMGLGLCIGPVLGAYVYFLFGYIGSFFFFALFILAINVICLYNMPARLNKTTQRRNKTS